MSLAYPVLFVSHGAPTFAIEPGQAGARLAELGRALPRPSAIVIVSPHWMTRGSVRVGSSKAPETIHAFGGFPQALYRLQYPATGNPALAEQICNLLSRNGIAATTESNRGLDHGAWVPLLHLLPTADIPVVQVSMPHPLNPLGAWQLGQALKPLRRLMQLGLFDAARTYLKLIDSSLQSELSSEQAAEKTVVAAQLTIEAGNLEQGLAQLQSVLNEQPLNGDALLLIANVQLDQEAYATATFYFERATSVVEVQVEALVGLARTAVAQSRFQAALKHLQQSQRIKQRPDVAQFMASIEKVIAAQ